MEKGEDKDLVQKAKADKTAFNKLYEKYGKNIYYFFWSRVGQRREIAEDLMQETFIRAYANLEKYEFRGYSYFAYLMGIARNLLVDYYRKPKEIALEEIESMAIAEPDFAIEQKDKKSILLGAVRRLSDAKRVVLYLYYWSGFSVKEIASLTKKSENAVKLLLLKGRRALALDPAIVSLVPIRARV